MCCPRDPLALQKGADGARKSNEKRGAQLVKTVNLYSTMHQSACVSKEDDLFCRLIFIMLSDTWVKQ